MGRKNTTQTGQAEIADLVKGASSEAGTLLASTKAPEVLGYCRHNICSEFHHNSTCVGISNFHIEVHRWIASTGVVVVVAVGVVVVVAVAGVVGAGAAGAAGAAVVAAAVVGLRPSLLLRLLWLWLRLLLLLLSWWL